MRSGLLRSENWQRAARPFLLKNFQINWPVRWQSVDVCWSWCPWIFMIWKSTAAWRILWILKKLMPKLFKRSAAVWRLSLYRSYGKAAQSNGTGSRKLHALHDSRNYSILCKQNARTVWALAGIERRIPPEIFLWYVFFAVMSMQRLPFRRLCCGKSIINWQNAIYIWHNDK